MCCTLERAKLSDTILYAGEAETKEHGLVHVLGYQNRAQNLASGPNAMILPFPAKEKMTKENVLDTSGCKHILKNMESAISPPVSRGGDLKLYGSKAPNRVEIFEHDIYTVILAQSALDVYEALSQVPQQKRPPLKEQIFKAYEKWYSGWPVALCCFDNKDAAIASPLLWWYKPLDERMLFAPALDSHTGEVPRINAEVLVDHTLVVSSLKLNGGKKVFYTDHVFEKVHPYLPQSVIGSKVTIMMPNGDFFYSIDQVSKGEFKPLRVCRT